MAWIRNRDLPFIQCSLHLPASGEVRYKALLDTGAETSVLPGEVVDVQPRLSEHGQFDAHIADVYRADRTVLREELTSVGIEKCRKWGDPVSRRHPVFSVPLTLGDGRFESVRFVILPLDRDDEEPQLVLGRSLLFSSGGICFDRRKSRFRLGVCPLARLF